MSIKNSENPRKWRFTWETQSHSPTLRLFLFDSHTKPLLHCKNLNAHLNLSQSQLFFSWLQGEDAEELSLRVPIPRVLIDPESPVSLRALDDHIEAKLVLLLPVDHPIVSSFDSVLSFSGDGDNVAPEAEEPLKMDSDLKSLSSIEGGVHFYCRSCSTRLTRSPLRHFVEMPSLDWQEVADNWFGACCCSFGGISEKLVTMYANSYKCASGVCLVNPTTVILCKDDLLESELYNWTQEGQTEPDFASSNNSDEATLHPVSILRKVSSCGNQREIMHDVNEKLSSMHLEDNLAANVQVTNEGSHSHKVPSALATSDENVASMPHCCLHMTDNVDETGKHNASGTYQVDQKPKLLPDQKLFLNGFLGTAFMARSSNLSTSIKWVELLCPQCLSLLGAYPSGNDLKPTDGGVRLFKCHISTSSPAGGSGDLFRKHTLERMFTNQLLESAKDELSFRTVIRDLKTKSPMLQIILLNPNSWCCTGYCLGTGSAVESVMKPNLLPVIKVLFSACSNLRESQLRMLDDWVKRNQADEVFMFTRQVDELFEALASRKDTLPPSCNSLQGLPVSSLQP
ncbi:hypothetical protein SLEP1_g12102 [Rubroshorea leprosula]|nr:hypothetical protein SLEP1_g12102 [Rubroshorea leprosula]